LRLGIVALPARAAAAIWGVTLLPGMARCEPSATTRRDDLLSQRRFTPVFLMRLQVDGPLGHEIGFRLVESRGIGISLDAEELLSYLWTN